MINTHDVSLIYKDTDVNIKTLEKKIKSKD